MPLLLATCAALTAPIQVWFQTWRGSRLDQPGFLEIVLGDSRRLFANHFFIKADIYFHSGYYPGIFEQAEQSGPLHIVSHAEEEHDPDHDQDHGQNGGAEESHDHDEHDDLGEFRKAPRTWIEEFGRLFIPNDHIHLRQASDARELLPWLRLSASLDPHRVETYTVAAFWLRTRLNRVDEAEQFLREGWRANPDSHEILFELGRLYASDRQDPDRARNFWEAALVLWERVESRKAEPDLIAKANMLIHLARLEQGLGRWAESIRFLEQLQPISPSKDLIAREIQEIRQKHVTPAP